MTPERLEEIRATIDTVGEHTLRCDARALLAGVDRLRKLLTCNGHLDEMGIAFWVAQGEKASAQADALSEAIEQSLEMYAEGQPADMVEHLEAALEADDERVGISRAARKEAS